MNRGNKDHDVLKFGYILLYATGRYPKMNPRIYQLLTLIFVIPIISVFIICCYQILYTELSIQLFVDNLEAASLHAMVLTL